MRHKSAARIRTQREKALRRSRRNSPSPKPASEAENARRSRRAARVGGTLGAGAAVQPGAVGAALRKPSTVEGKAARHPKRSALELLTVDVLKDKATTAKIPGRSKMKKDELIDALLAL